MAVELTRELIRIDSSNPPGREAACADVLGSRLETAGFVVSRHEFAPGRTSLVARIGGDTKKRPLCLTGHMDVVPVGAAPWRRDPFAAELDGDHIHGRGASDMKSGLAAMVVAAIRSVKRVARSAGLLLVITAGEETGCDGARDLLRRGILGSAGALIVGEPTSNEPYLGHKGCSRFRCIAKGITAHSSMPELGENAIYKAAAAIIALERLEFGVGAHPIMGHPTLVVSQIRGGMNINSVPDRAEFAIDVRTVPGQDLGMLRDQLDSAIGDRAVIEPIAELPSIFSDPGNEWIQSVFARAQEITGAKSVVRTASYFTDAAVLRDAFGEVPTVILGPGEAPLAHQTDEYCKVSRLLEAVELYERLIDDWCIQPRSA